MFLLIYSTEKDFQNFPDPGAFGVKLFSFLLEHVKCEMNEIRRTADNLSAALNTHDAFHFK